MAYDQYQCLKFRSEAGVLWVTIDHPPVNLFDIVLMQEMTRAGAEIAHDDSIRVVVIESADPEFFIAHADVNLIQMLPTEPDTKPGELGAFHAMVDRFRTMDKVTIAKIAGRCRGGGSEFVLSCDMRFAALETAVFAQPEVSVGIIPGGSGTQRLPRLMGRGRALEVVLGCLDYTAELAERYGYINRALPLAELDGFVRSLALRIASYPAEALALAKRSVLLSDRGVEEALREEERLFYRSAATTEAKARMAAYLEAGGQTREVELALDGMGLLAPG